MTNAERQTHVIRILGTNKAGDVLPEMWADVERIDRMEIMTQVIQGPAGAVNQYQKVTIKLRWLDDPDGPDYDPDGDKNREHKIVKVCDPSLPQDKLDDPDEWIPIRSIVRMEVKHAGGNIIKHFKESDPTINYDGRVVANRRITHWETTIDKAAQAAFDADPTRKVYVEPDGNRKYERIEDTEDKDQYVEHQIVKKLNRQDSQQLLSTGNDQRRVLHLKNQYQIDESHPAKLEELGKDAINPPYRLDPFQNIVNCQFKPIYAQDLLVCGYGGVDGVSYMLFGVRDGEFTVLDSGGRFGTGPVVGGYNGTIEGSRSIDPVIQAIGESIVSYDDIDEGEMLIGSPGWYIDPTGGPEWGSATIYTHFDSINADDDRAISIDLTGGKGMEYWEKKNGLSNALNQSAPNGDYLASTGDLYTLQLRDKNNNVKATITLNSPKTQTLENGTTVTLRGQDHIGGMVFGKGGKAWLYIIQDFDDPSGTGILTYLPGDDPFSDSLVGMEYQNQLTTYLRVFDKNGEELARIPWGTTIDISQEIGGAEGDAFRVAVGSEYCYPLVATPLMAPIESTSP